MASDMTIKIDTCAGESTVDKHTGEIDVLAWSWGVAQSGTSQTAGGSGAGRASFTDLSFTHYLDSASARLMLACATGAHIPNVVLSVRKAGGTQGDYFVITLKDTLISSVSGGGSTGTDDRFTENVTINFSSFKIDYKPQKKDGSLDSAISSAFDLKALKKA